MVIDKKFSRHSHGSVKRPLPPAIPLDNAVSVVSPWVSWTLNKDDYRVFNIIPFTRFCRSDGLEQMVIGGFDGQNKKTV